ncbi:FAD-dependent oxidoreductase [Chloroflexota bacterium]
MAQLKHLFQPIKIGSMEIENRIVVSAMGVGFGADENGCPTDQLIEFTGERAKSRPGMMLSGASYVHPSGIPHSSYRMESVYLWDDRVLPQLEKLVKAVHQYDVKFGAQINHAGLSLLPDLAYCPSELPVFGMMGMTVKVTTKDDIEMFIDAFGSAADRCIKAGFDFIEIHSGHGYLIESFLTPFFNQRTDEYGGSFENRIRFLLEVFREIRKRVGDGIPIGLKLNGDDFIPEGAWGMDDLCKLAPILEKEGAAYLNITCGTSNYWMCGPGSVEPMIAPMYVDQGDRVRFAEGVKKTVSIPVATVGRIKDPVMADQIIQDGRADLVAMARAFLADPEFVEKARNGNIDDIRPCLGDCLGCIENIFRYGQTSCTVNPRVAREYQIKDVEGDKKTAAKKVLVAGSGPAGLEAARRAAFAGHKVILCDKRGWIGGQMKLAAAMPKRVEMADIIPWYERQLHKYGVEIRLNNPVDDKVLDEINPDVLIVATGSLPQMPQGLIDGLENVDNIEPMMADELIEDKQLTGDSVLIVGGDQVGLQLVDHLTEKGKRVFITQQGPDFAPRLATTDRYHLEQRLLQRDMKRYPETEKIEILAGDEVWVVSAVGRENLPGIDTIVFAGERRPDRFLVEIAEKKGIETIIIGDANGVSGEGQGTVMAAIAAGYDAGRQI